MSAWKSERERTIDEGREFILAMLLERGPTWSIEWRNPDAPHFQLAKVDGPDFSLIIYPHKTSAGNHHMRIRDNGSKDRVAYQKAVEAFYIASGNNCSFQTKNASGTISPEAFREAAR